MPQFHAFLLCAACGIAGGLLYDVFFCLVYPFKKRPIRIAADVLFCLLFAGIYLLFSTLAHLPPFRSYLFVGLCLGFFLHRKSLHKTVAFLVKKVYNNHIRVKSVKKERKTCRKRKEFRKKKRAVSP